MKFILLYIALDVYTKIHGQNIRWLKTQDYLHDAVDTKVTQELKRSLDAEPHINMNPEGDHRWDGKVRTENDFDSVIEFIIRARNNLFHGDKGLDNVRDIFIVTYGNKIIEPILKRLFENE